MIVIWEIYKITAWEKFRFFKIDKSLPFSWTFSGKSEEQDIEIKFIWIDIKLDEN